MNDHAGAGSGSPVVLYTCNRGANELWSHNSHGEYVLKAHGSTLCLDDPAYSTRNGTHLIVYTCKDQAASRPFGSRGVPLAKGCALLALGSLG
jgi:hypothetical protein